MSTSLSQIMRSCFGSGSNQATAAKACTLHRQEGETVTSFDPNGKIISTEFVAKAKSNGKSSMSQELPSTNGSLLYTTGNCHAYVPAPKSPNRTSLIAAIGPGECYPISPNSWSFPRVKPEKFGPCSLVIQTPEDKQSGIPYENYRWTKAAGEAGRCHLVQTASGSFGEILPSNFWQMPQHCLKSTLELYSWDKETPKGIAKDSLGKQPDLSIHRASMVEIDGVEVAFIINECGKEALYWLTKHPVCGIIPPTLPCSGTFTKTLFVL